MVSSGGRLSVNYQWWKGLIRQLFFFSNALVKSFRFFKIFPSDRARIVLPTPTTTTPIFIIASISNNTTNLSWYSLRHKCFWQHCAILLKYLVWFGFKLQGQPILVSCIDEIKSFYERGLVLFLLTNFKD